MKTLFGREIKSSKWNIVEGSLKKFDAKTLKNISCLVAKQSNYSDCCYLTVEFKDGSYCNLPLLDKKIEVKVGTLMDPKSFMLYKITNGDKTIERCFARAL